ncbi:MAG TPA: TetR family transcriptional regulator C-terminal domain-containing protein [Gemmatimonadaceae bacterium]|jgi:Transcriptional regulator
MPRPSLREQILDAGLRVMFRAGFVGASVRDVMREAAAPQGSFTNHFRSKEAFAGEVLDRYFAHVRGLVRQALDDPSLTPRERLRRYLDLITERLAADDFTRGCLIGDFSLEAAPISEPLRAQLAAIYAEWRVPFARCIAEAQRAGEIAASMPADELADFLLASWQGAILRMKVDRTPAALERFKAIAFQTVFATSSATSPSSPTGLKPAEP